ncbi:MAG: D-alanyl-D-alanine carboxypeptidase, partial [Burkholderiaceae bacterium]|nr:D-alanyl-D-alanine carboxypeptidase [Burkholderiaceae bacterium]
PQGESDKLQTKIGHTDPLLAPLAKGQRVGSVRVSTAGGELVAEVPLVMLEAVEPAGVLKRAWDTMRLWVQ